MNKSAKIVLIDIIQYIVIIVLGIFCVVLSFRGRNEVSHLQEYVDNRRDYNQLYFDMKIKDLEDKNKELYDSIKIYKDAEYALQIKLQKAYSIKEVLTDSITHIKQSVEKQNNINVYSFENTPNDSINYKLRIGSTTKPKWYELDLKINEKLTIVNRKENELNQAIIKSENDFEITDATFYHSKQKKKFKDRFIIGLQLNVGYDIFRNRPALTIGVGITFDCSK